MDICACTSMCMCVFIYVPRPEDNLRHYPQVSNPPSWGWGLFLAQRSPIRLGWQVSEPQGSSCLHLSSPGVTSLHHQAQHSYMGAGNQMQIFMLAKRVLDRLNHSSALISLSSTHPTGRARAQHGLSHSSRNHPGAGDSYLRCLSGSSSSGKKIQSRLGNGDTNVAEYPSSELLRPRHVQYFR